MIPWLSDPAGLPAEPGAYILWVDLAEAVPLPPRLAGGPLPAGRYLYVGSARGAGGIRGRCARHFRPDKKRHWHVDWLTASAARVTAAAFPGRDECDLVRRVLEAGGTAVAVTVAGFGSTDCRRCRAHLLTLAGAPAPDFLDRLYQ